MVASCYTLRRENPKRGEHILSRPHPLPTMGWCHLCVKILVISFLLLE